jgi:hypothetical protein
MNSGLVIISGATGFIGRALAASLIDNDYEVAVLTRNREKARALFGDRVIIAEWDGQSSRGWRELAGRALAVVNLAGENIGADRWTDQRKQCLAASRLDVGRAIVEAFQINSMRPKVLVQASAVGYYGASGDEELDESAPPGQGFLAGLVRDWEASTAEVEELGVRRVVIRSALVLEKEGGVLPRFLWPHRFFIGGPLGPGTQWVSWIHREDEVAAIRFLLEKKDLRGVFNLAAPQPLTMKDFSRTLGRVMNRPSWFPVPSSLLRLLFGEMAQETLLIGQRVMPVALLKAGFTFIYPTLSAGLNAILNKND